jgi:hypothetical protein
MDIWNGSSRILHFETLAQQFIAEPKGTGAGAGLEIKVFVNLTSLSKRFDQNIQDCTFVSSNLLPVS